MDVSSRRNHIFLQLDEDYEGGMKVTSPHWLQHLLGGEPVQELLLRQGCLPFVLPEIETNWKIGEKKNQVKFNCKWGESHVSRFQTALYPCVEVDGWTDQLEIQTDPFSVQPLTDDFFVHRPSYQRLCSLSILTMDGYQFSCTPGRTPDGHVALHWSQTPLSDIFF